MSDGGAIASRRHLVHRLLPVTGTEADIVHTNGPAQNRGQNTNGRQRQNLKVDVPWAMEVGIIGTGTSAKAT